MSLNYLSDDYDPTGCTDEEISAAQDRAIAVLWRLKLKNENEYAKKIPFLYCYAIASCFFFPITFYVYIKARSIKNSENVYINYKTKTPVIISTLSAIVQIALICSLLFSVFNVNSTGAGEIVYGYILSILSFAPFLFLCMLHSGLKFKRECRKRDRLFLNKESFIKNAKHTIIGFFKTTTIKNKENPK